MGVATIVSVASGRNEPEVSGTVRYACHPRRPGIGLTMLGGGVVGGWVGLEHESLVRRR